MHRSAHLGGMKPASLSQKYRKVPQGSSSRELDPSHVPKSVRSNLKAGRQAERHFSRNVSLLASNSSPS